jgi:hypothetical protein
MPPTAPKTSSRLLRAAAAERAELDRHRDRLLIKRDGLRAEIERIEAALVDVDERLALLDRLAPHQTGAGASAPRLADELAQVTEQSGASDARTLVRGTAIRETAVRVLASSPRSGSPIHYRRWLELVEQAGYTVMGKDVPAVFLTQLSRSPVVRKTTESGVYELDRDAPERLRRRLAALQGRLRSATTTPADAADLASLRAEREQTIGEIAQVERALEEAARSLVSARESDARTPTLAAAAT